VPELAGQEEPFPEPDNQSKMKRSCENAEQVGEYFRLLSRTRLTSLQDCSLQTRANISVTSSVGDGRSSIAGLVWPPLKNPTTTRPFTIFINLCMMHCADGDLEIDHGGSGVERKSEFEFRVISSNLLHQL
jgi:hypothetical protein